MLAAAAAATLLAVALLSLYTLSSPIEIAEDRAIINVNIYNNVHEQDIEFVLSPASDTDRILQEGALKNNKESLKLYDLTPGTRYVLQYFSMKDGNREYIGDFEFITPGDPPGPAEPPVTPSAPVPSQEPDGQKETMPETPETTEETQESPATVPEDPTKSTEPAVNWTPPAPPAGPKPNPTPKPNPDPSPDPTPGPTPDPEPEPEPDPDPITPPAPEPVDMGSIQFHPGRSGTEFNGYYTIEQFHIFRDVPAAMYEAISVTQNDVEVDDFTAEFDSGDLRVTVMGNMVAIGETATTMVTVTWPDKTTVTSTHTITPPSLKDVALTVTKNPDDTHTFTVTVTADPSSDQALSMEVLLYASNVAQDTVPVSMTRTDPHTYVGTYTTHIDSPNAMESCLAFVSAVWELAETPEPGTRLQSITSDLIWYDT